MPFQLFPNMPESSRLFVFTTDALLSDAYSATLIANLNAFLSSWAAHGTPLFANASLISNRVLVISLDESAASASGCSIDSLTNFIKSEGVTSGIDFFNRSWVLYRNPIADLTNFTDDWTTEPLNAFWARRKAGLINDDTQVLNTTVTTLIDARTNLVQAFSDSWHASMW
ncbi:MAG: hypothetical protein OSA04_08790 [Flavobacteriales bacterium]|nr:hypothetical protein [Flavobacteriales bacterium]